MEKGEKGFLIYLKVTTVTTVITCVIKFSHKSHKSISIFRRTIHQIVLLIILCIYVIICHQITFLHWFTLKKRKKKHNSKGKFKNSWSIQKERISKNIVDSFSHLDENCEWICVQFFRKKGFLNFFLNQTVFRWK